MALIIKSDKVTGSDFVPGVLQKLLLEKEKTGQERLQIKQFEFLEEIQFDFNKDIYGENLKVRFIKKIRDSIKINPTNKYRLEVVSLRDSKTADAILVELNIVNLSA
mgnify:CR=1 FL=1